MSFSTSSSEQLRTERSAARYTRIALAITISTSVVFALASLYLVVAIVSPQDDLEKRLALLDAAGTKNAVFGDSKMANAFIGTPDFVNLAYPAENILDMRTASELYFKARRPGRVILQAAPNNFSYYRLTGPAKGYLVTAAERSLWRDHHRGYLFAYWSTLLTKGRLENTGRFSEFGWQERFGDQSKKPIEVRLAEASALSPIDQPSPNFRNHPHTAIFRNLVKYLVAQGAKVCLVTLPVSREFHRLARQNPNFPAAFRYYQDVADENGVPYVDAFSLLHGVEDLRLFHNADHLNAIGARWLTDYAMRHCYGILSP